MLVTVRKVVPHSSREEILWHGHKPELPKRAPFNHVTGVPETGETIYFYCVSYCRERSYRGEKYRGKILCDLGGREVG